MGGPPGPGSVTRNGSGEVVGTLGHDCQTAAESRTRDEELANGDSAALEDDELLAEAMQIPGGAAAGSILLCPTEKKTP